MRSSSHSPLGDGRTNQYVKWDVFLEGDICVRRLRNPSLENESEN